MHRGVGFPPHRAYAIEREPRPGSDSVIEERFKAFFEDFDDATSDVKKSTQSTFETNLERWFEVLEENLELVAIVDHLESSIDFYSWFDGVSLSSEGMNESGQIRWPSGSSSRLAMQVAFMRAVLKGQPSYVDVSHAFFAADRNNQMIDATCTHIFNPAARDLRKYLARYTDDSNSERNIPASDRVVKIDHNSSGYEEALLSLDSVEMALQAVNDIDPVEKEQRVAEIKAGRSLLQATQARAESIISVLYKSLKYITKKFTDHYLGAAAAGALTLIGRLTGLW